MGSKPKQQDYEASDAEKASASVAMAEYQFFKEKYDPLLQQMRDKSMQEDPGDTLRGRANADTMQALTSQPSYQQTQSTTATGDMAQAYQGQLGQANTAAKNVQNQMRTNVLGTARGRQQMRRQVWRRRPVLGLLKRWRVRKQSSRLRQQSLVLRVSLLVPRLCKALRTNRLQVWITLKMARWLEMGTDHQHRSR